MEQSISSLAFKGSVTEAIFEAKRQKKLFVVYISGENSESSNLEKSTWTELNLAEALAKYCILLHISEGSVDAANLSAIYPQKTAPCITVIGYNGLQLWQNEGFVTAEVLASSLEKAWLSLHIQDTTASVLTAALAAKKTEQLAPGASSSSLPGQGTSSSSNAPSPSTDTHIPFPEDRTPTDVETGDENKNISTKEINPHVGNVAPAGNVSPALQSEPRTADSEQASQIVDEPFDPVKLESGSIGNRHMSVNEEVGHPVQEKNSVNQQSEVNKVTSEGIVGDMDSAVKAETLEDNKNVSSNKSDVHLNIRLPDCTSLQEKFSLTSTLREVKNYVDEKQQSSMSSYDLAIPYPRKVFGNEDLSKTLSDLGLFDRQALILVPHSRVTGYPSLSRRQTSPINDVGSSNGSSEGYFSLVRRMISYVNPFSYFGGATNSPSTVHQSQSSTRQYSPNPVIQNNLGSTGTNQSAGPSSSGARKRPTASRFGSNIHTLKHDEDDDQTRDKKNTFWNGNSTQYGGDNDGK